MREKPLSEHQYPAFDPHVDEALLDDIKRRETQIPAVDELNQSD